MIAAQPSHTFLLCSGVNGCINGMIVSVSLANDTPLIRISDGICQSIISIISAISAILTPSVQFNGNRLNSLCFNRTPASDFLFIYFILPQFYKFTSFSYVNFDNLLCNQLKLISIAAEKALITIYKSFTIPSRRGMGLFRFSAGSRNTN